MFSFKNYFVFVRYRNFLIRIGRKHLFVIIYNQHHWTYMETNLSVFIAAQECGLFLGHQHNARRLC